MRSSSGPGCGSGAWNQGKRGIPVDEWLFRYFIHDDYWDVGCFVFHGDSCVGWYDDYGKATTERCFVAREKTTTTGQRKKLGCALSMANPPRTEAMVGDAARRARVCIVRKSSDSIFVNKQTCGSRNSWRNTKLALFSQLTRAMYDATNATTTTMCRTYHEVAFSALNNLRFFCLHVPELRSLVRSESEPSSPSVPPCFSHAIWNLASPMAVCESFELDDVARKSAEKTRSSCMRIRNACIVLARWFPYSMESDIGVASHHASIDMRKMFS